MTIKCNHNVTIREPQTDNRCNDVWRIEDGQHWNSATECAKDIGVCLPMMYGALNGKYKTCKGYHYAYGKDVLKVQRLMGKRIADMTEVMNQLQADAAVGRAVREEQEAARKAEEKHQAEIAKAKEKLERRKRICERIDAEYQAAVRRLMEAENELQELGVDIK